MTRVPMKLHHRCISFKKWWQPERNYFKNNYLLENCYQYAYQQNISYQQIYSHNDNNKWLSNVIIFPRVEKCLII